MKNSAFYKKYEKYIKKVILALIIIILALLVWVLFLKNLVSFKKMETELKNAGRLYYEKNLNKYPKEVGDVSTVDLQELYDRGDITSLYIPGKKTLCSADNSFVKVKKTKSGYEYLTYLECGKYKSNVDHEGPIITLNGNDQNNIDYGSKYKELGIKSVVDNKEGNLKVQSVDIVGKVDSEKVGTYKIKYVAYDSWKNKTVKYRTIKVVKTLGFITKEDTKNNVYMGDVSNNYVLYSGMLWRIVKVNNDGSIKLITNDSLANIAYSTGTDKDGYVYNWLNDYFYNKLYKPEKYIVKSNWCNDNTKDVNYKDVECKNNSSKYNVGLISLAEYNQSIKDGVTFIDNGMTFWTMTYSDDKNVFANHSTYNMEATSINNFNGVRPVINIKKNISVKSGEGSSTAPYVLEGYEYGKVGKPINTRYAGEYIRYSGHLWRIMGTDEEGNTQIVMDSVLSDGNEDYVEVSYGKSYDNKVKEFNVKSKDNIGYILNKKLKDYLITNKFTDGVYEVNYYKNGVIDKKAKNKKVKALLSIPDVTEIFSLGTAEGENDYYYYIRNTIDSKYGVLLVNGMSQTEEFSSKIFSSCQVKIVTSLNNNTLIKLGKGTYLNPYELR